LIPSLDTQRAWAGGTYRHITDSRGQRSGPCADTGQAPGPAKARRTVFIMGDSFTESVGVDFGRTFAGRLACKHAGRGIRILNLGVTSFSPVIYHRKLRAFVRQTGIVPDHVLLMLDISDIYDDAETYEERDGKVVLKEERGVAPTVARFLRRNLTTAKFIGFLKDKLLQATGIRNPLAEFFVPRYLDDEQAVSHFYGFFKARWTMDPAAFAAYGERGLEIAAGNMDKLARLCSELGCRLSVAVYPWPDQIFEKDVKSRQVAFWKAWTERSGTGFINLFPPFFGEDPIATIERYYIKADSHWNEAGHEVIFRALDKALSGSVLAPAD
jgi:lysophospholipase L1-like esterase